MFAIVIVTTGTKWGWGGRSDGSVGVVERWRGGGGLPNTYNVWTEVGKVTFKINGDEALSDESV